MDEVPERKFYLQHFKAITHALVTYDDLNLLMKHIAEGTSKRFKAQGCSIMLLDEREQQLVHVRSYGISDEYLRKGPVVIDPKHCAIATGEPVYIKDMQSSQLVQYPDAAAKEGMVSILSVPIKSQQTTIGVLRIYHSESYNYHEEDINTLCIMSEVLGMVIESNGLKNFLDSVKMALANLPLHLLEGL
jgi:signal transduction protein with GAF and PtsI domain